MNIKQLISWIDEHLLLILASFLLAFIPLYPKLPLFEAIPGYIVRIRLEDLAVFFTMLVWGIQVVRKKVEWRTPITVVVLLYLVVGALSTLSAVVVTKTVPAELLHIGKTLLHLFRYLEYFSLLFVTYSAIKKPSHLKVMLTVIAVTVLAISIYGLGQRYWYWPVYSTMNREFSKGVRLYLTEHARVQSTFGGHYDLGAYLVIVSPMLLAGFYLLRRIWQKVAMITLFLFSYWLLIVTASRASYGGFFLAVVLVIGLIAYSKRISWGQRMLWALKHGFLIASVTMFMLVTFGDSMYERLLQTLEAYPTINRYYHTVNDKKNILVQEMAKMVDPDEKMSLSFNRFFGAVTDVQPPKNGISVEEAQVMVASDTRPSTVRPSDVYVNVPDYETVATTSADGTVTQIIIEKERTYTENAQTYGLSFAIRLDTLWPRAIQGFYNNPLLGSGYATLTKEAVGQFTEAESTDNNFLRTLGETGALGFLTFYGAVALAMYVSWKLYTQHIEDSLVNIFAIAFFAGSVGLLFNAIFIDVYAASKVAFTYWSLAGVVMACASLYGSQPPYPHWMKSLRFFLPVHNSQTASARTRSAVTRARKINKKSKKLK